LVHDGDSDSLLGTGAPSSRAEDLVRPLQAERLAHDLGNYLTAISGLAQVGRLMKVAEAKDAYLSRIESAVDDMARMVRVVLADRCIDLREMTDGDSLCELAQEVAGLMQPQFAAKSVCLRLMPGRGVPPCRVARTPIKQVLVNLIDNALRATPPGGEVTIKLSACNLPKGVHIRVQDTGVGIPKQLLSQVCAPGYTTRADGYGLGLSVAREIVEVMHGGKLSLRSRHGSGTVVNIFLPC
jgi:signal transduction histidine kinase